jgi:hypothetical protein
MARAVIDVASSGDNTIVAAAGGQSIIRVHAWTLTAAGALTVRWESGASGTALSGQVTLATGIPWTSGWCEEGWFDCAANTLLNLELSAGTSVDGIVIYRVIT